MCVCLPSYMLVSWTPSSKALYHTYAHIYAHVEEGGVNGALKLNGDFALENCCDRLWKAATKSQDWEREDWVGRWIRMSGNPKRGIKNVIFFFRFELLCCDLRGFAVLGWMSVSGGIWTAFQTFNIKECRHLFLRYLTQTHTKAKALSIWIGPWIIGPLRVITFITRLPAKGIKSQHQISTHGYGKYCAFLKNIFVSIILFFFFSSLKVFQIHQTWVDILLGNQNSLFSSESLSSRESIGVVFCICL